MLDNQQLRDFIKKSVSSSEIGNTSPYVSVLSTGNSGLSFGALQNDVGNNSIARTAFRKILDAEVDLGALTSAQADSLYSKASQNFQLSSAERVLVDKALLAHTSLVDAADEQQLIIIERYVNLALDAASKNPNGPGSLDRNNLDLQFVAELAMWGNRTGGLSSTAQFLETATEVSRQNYELEYLSKQAQFTNTSEDFSRWQERVDEATLSGLLKITIDASNKGLFTPLGWDATLGYFGIKFSGLSDIIDKNAFNVLLDDIKNISIDSIGNVELDANGNIKLNLLSNEFGNATSVLYKSNGTQVSIAGITLIDAPKEAQVSIDQQNVSVINRYGDLSATYRLSREGVVVAWKNADGGLAVEQTYGFDGVPVKTTWKQNGTTFSGAEQDLAAFISKSSIQANDSALAGALQSKQAATTVTFGTAADGVAAAADNAASLRYLQKRLGLEGVSDRWAPIALSGAIPASLALSNSLAAAIQQAINNAQQRWNTSPNSIFYVSVVSFGNEPLVHRLPLVMDLSGNGIKLVAPSQSNAVFDLNADGIKRPVGWVGADNGILVFDTNRNGVIDSAAEWFGEAFVVPGSTGPAGKNGFEALAKLTKPGSTVFSRETSLVNPLTGTSYFDALNVWVDADQNGVSSAGELRTLAALNIKSIDLTSVHDGRQIAGGLIDSTAGFTLNNGARLDIADIGLSAPTSNVPATSSINPGALIFAEYASKGFAAMAAGQARGVDAALATHAPNFTGLMSALRTWMASARSHTYQGYANPLIKTKDPALITTYEGSNPATQRGSTAGKDVLTLMQQGAAYYTTVRSTLQAVDAGASALARAQSAAQVANAVSTVDSRATAQAQAQAAATAWGAAATSYLNTVGAWATYAAQLEALRGGLNNLVPINQSYTGHLPGGYTFFSPQDSGFAADTFTAYTALLQLFRDLKIGVDASLGAFAQSAGYAKAYTGITGGTVTLDNGYNLVLAGQGAQRFVLNSKVDNVLLSQASGQVTLQGFQAGSAGDQIQLLGLGNAAAITSIQGGLRVSAADGQRYVDLLGVTAQSLNLFANFSGVRALSFAGFNQAGVRSLQGNSLNDGQVHVNEITASNLGDTLIGGDWASVLRGGTANDTLVIKGQGYWLDGGGGVDQVSYADATGSVTANLSTGKDSFGSTLYNIENLAGSAWRDILTGSSTNNVLTGGRGNDRLEGAGGNDVFVFDRGDGQDTVFNGVSGNASPSSILKLRAGIKASDLWLSREGNNLVLTVLGSHDRVTVQDWFAADYRKLAAIELDSGLRLGSNGVELAIATQQAWKQANPTFDPLNPSTSGRAPSLAGYFTAQVEIPLVPSVSSVALETKRIFESGSVTQGKGLAGTAVNTATTAVTALSTKITSIRSLAAQVSSVFLNPNQNTYRYQTSQDAQTYTVSTPRDWNSTNPLLGRPSYVTSFQRITALNADAFYIQKTIDISSPSSTSTPAEKLERGVGAVGASITDLTAITSSLSTAVTAGQAVASSATARQSALEQAVKANDTKNLSTAQLAGTAASAFEQGLGRTVVLYQDALSRLSEASLLITRNRDRLGSILPANSTTTTKRFIPTNVLNPNVGTWVDVITTTRYDWASATDKNKAAAILFAQAAAQDAYAAANASMQTYKTALGSILGYTDVRFLSGTNAAATASAAGSLLISGAGSNQGLTGGAGRDTLLFTDIAGAKGHLVKNFQAGLGGDRLLLSAGLTTAYLDQDASTQARVSYATGGPLLTLTGLNLNNLSLYDNLLGVSTVDYSKLVRGIDVSLDSLTPRDFDGFTHVQNLTGSAFADRLSGDSRDNVLNGGAGADMLSGKGGKNTLNGGEGVDTVSYDGAPSGVLVDLSKGTASNGYGGVDRLTGIENVLGSAYDDILSGDAGANRLQGGAGNDLLSGGGGYDRYVTARGKGHDTVVNGIGGVRGELQIDNETRQSLWFARSGNDLRVQLLGSDTDITVQGWYDASVSKLEKIALGGSSSGYVLGAQVDQLVQAMAGFSASHPGFDPKTSGVISDASLLATVNSSWLTTPAT